MAPVRLRGAEMALAVALAVTACGSGPSLASYADQVEALVTTMNTRLDEAVLAQPSPPTVEGIRALWTERAHARWDFVEALAGLEPPETAADLHDAALELVAELAVAETALAERAASVGTLEEMAALAEGPEAEAFAAVDERAVQFCRAAQERLDATETAEGLVGVPFIPPEMQEVVVVAFRCTAEERGLLIP